MNIKVGTVYIDVEPDVSKFSEKLRRKLQDTDLGKAVEQSIDKATKSVVRFGRDSDRTSVSLDKIGDRTTNFNNKMLLLRNTLSLIKFPAVFAGLGLAAQLLVALAAGAIAVVAAFGPLTGLIIAMPAGLLAVASAAITVKLAFNDITEAIKGTEGALEKLGPAGRQFVMFVKQLEPLKEELENIAASNLLPGIMRGMQSAFSANNIGAVRTIIEQTARSLGNLADLLGRELRDPEWAEALLTVSETSTRAFDKLGRAVIKSAGGFRDLLIAGQPLIRWITDILAKGIELAGAWASNAASSGKASRFFQETADITHLLGSILGRLFRALMDIGRAAYPLGKTILVALNDQLGKLRDWTQSAGGQRSLAAYFERTVPLLESMVRLVGALAKSIFGMGEATKESGLTAFFDQIRTEVLPIFENAVKDADGLGQALLDLAVAAAKFAAIMMSSSGPLQAFAGALASVAGALADLLANNPLLADLVVTFASVLTLSKAFNLKGMVTSIWAAVTALRAQAAAGAVAATAQQRLNLAMRANPIGLIVTAIQILAVGLFLLWKRSETFRNAVKKLFSFLRDTGVVILKAITFQFRLFLRVVEFLLKGLSHLPFIGDKFKGAAEKIKAVRDGLDGAIEKLSNVGKAGDDAGKSLDNMASKASRAIVKLDAVGTTLKAKLSSAQASLAKVGESLTDTFTDFTSKSLKAFDAETSRMLENLSVKVTAYGKSWVMKPGDLTPAERELAALDKAEAKRDRQLKKASLLKDLAEASKTVDVEQEIGGKIVTFKRAPDKDRIKEIKEQLRDLKVDDARATLQQRAEVEKAAADEAIERAQLEYQAQRDVQREHFEKQLEALKESVASGKLEGQKAQEETLALLARYGVRFRTAGANLGQAFAQSLNTSVKSVQTQAEKTHAALVKVLEIRKKIDAYEALRKKTLATATGGGTAPDIATLIGGFTGQQVIGQYVQTQVITDEATARAIGNQAARKVPRR